MLNRDFSQESLDLLWKSVLKGGRGIADAFNNKIEESKRKFDELDKKINEANKANIIFSQVEFLDTQLLMSTAKSIVVPGANGIAVLREKGEDGAATIHMTNVKDRELLPSASNRYAIIKAGALSSDVKSLFADGELQILN